jgi:hypothetical protein
MKKLRKMNKKGAIEMSINTIVILLLALAMLGVGMFVINKIRSQVDLFEDQYDVEQQKKDQLSRDLESMGSNFLIETTEINMRVNEELENYYALKNVLNEKKEFTINSGCIGGIDTGSDILQKIKIEHISKTKIGPGETKVQRFWVDPDPSAEPSYYECEINVTYTDDTGGDIEYSSQNFNLNLKP